MFTNTTSTPLRRTAARVAIAGAITVFPLTAVAVPAAADSGSAPPGVTQVDRPGRDWDNRNDWDHNRKWDHDRRWDHDKNWDHDRKWDHDKNWDRGRGHDPFWWLLRSIIPRGFGSF
ncbi:hypothetical protein GV794_15115 [Nocardia cyriacigeorgica]|uniref:Secreted protein n=1 Tax=Nocardia cyriacigeorgica TaxID=135487 RepID=A0A6P1D922_9NOCA|nr:hypothetical protein [Nocardia cyriacigeorgica]NEW41274.1 hypothetical protein [Nocardia cyriacigeorgica]NEW46598.1 hypothetical protein [Nocardia cyriacigeorgica]NEW52177.1 hypothetical protein [Nocardia cyriacigeorgica]NEW56977.1 hypothetical protein [Nocardia cyriacigeorgica]